MYISCQIQLTVEKAMMPKLESIDMINIKFYYATIAYHVGLNAVLGLPHPGPTS